MHIPKRNLTILPYYLLLITTSLSLNLFTEAQAAPDPRGKLGSLFMLSAGGFLSTGTDQEGERSDSQLGGSIHLTLAEEVIPQFVIGIGIDSYIGSGQGGARASTSQVYSFGFEARYRLAREGRGLVFLGGMGLGVGGIISEGETLTEAENSGGGSVWKLGVGYELGDPTSNSGLIYTPRLLFQRIGPQMSSEVSMNLISLSFEVGYALGRVAKIYKAEAQTRELMKPTP